MTRWRTRIRRDRASARIHSDDSSGNDAPSLISIPATPAKEAVRKSAIGWINFGRPSRRLLRGLLRMRVFLMLSEDYLMLRSARRARLEARTTSLQLCV